MNTVCSCVFRMDTVLQSDKEVWVFVQGCLPDAVVLDSGALHPAEMLTGPQRFGVANCLKSEGLQPA